jgi:hypothetical protein
MRWEALGTRRMRNPKDNQRGRGETFHGNMLRRIAECTPVILGVNLSSYDPSSGEKGLQKT